MSEYFHKELIINDEKIFFLGLHKSRKYEDIDLNIIWRSQAGIETYKGLRWNKYFETPNRAIVDKTLSIVEQKKQIKRHEGYNFSAVLEFISEKYGDMLWNISQKIHRIKDADKYYRCLKKVEENITIQHLKLSAVNKICALYYISPEIIKTGKGSIFLFSDTAKQKYDLAKKESAYRNYIIQNFSSEDDVDKLSDSSQIIGLSKSEIAKWSGINEEDILECKAIVAYNVKVIPLLACEIIEKAIED